MPARHVRGFALSVLLLFVLSTVPATAAPRGDDGGREVAPVTKVIKKLATLVVRVLDTLTLPKP